MREKEKLEQEIIMSKKEYDEVIQCSKQTEYAIDDYIAYRFLEHNPSAVRVTRLYVKVLDNNGKLYTSLVVDIGEDEQRTREFLHRDYKIVIEPYGKNIHSKKGLIPCETYETPIYRYFIMPTELCEDKEWEFTNKGYTNAGRALQNAKKVIDERIDNLYWLGTHEHEGYQVRISQHGLKSTLSPSLFPFFKYEIIGWEDVLKSDPESGDGSGYGFRKASEALYTAQCVINRYVQRLRTEYLEMVKKLNALSDEKATDNAIESVDDTWWDEEEKSIVDEDEYWQDIEEVEKLDKYS